MDTNTAEACVLIPARYSSSRFPGKPLAEIHGRPLILWVADIATKAVGLKHVYVATDDIRIYRLISDHGYTAIMTSHQAMTGTDRVAEAAKHLDNYKIIINLQGDEPLVDPQDVLNCIRLKKLYPDEIINAYYPIDSLDELLSANTPKVVFDSSHRLLYMSRSVIPGSKEPIPEALPQGRYNKQVCIYGFSRKELDLFSSCPRKSPLEKEEDIEILRFLELDYPVRLYPALSSSAAVDVPGDISKVEALMAEHSLRQ